MMVRQVVRISTSSLTSVTAQAVAAAGGFGRSGEGKLAGAFPCKALTELAGAPNTRDKIFLLVPANVFRSPNVLLSLFSLTFTRCSSLLKCLRNSSSLGNDRCTEGTPDDDNSIFSSFLWPF